MKTAVAFVHIFVATIWLGSAFFYTVLLLPKLRGLEPTRRRALDSSLRSTMTPVLAVSALATIASGLVMMVQLHSRHPGSFSQTRWGVSLVIGALASLLAVALAFFSELRLRRRDAVSKGTEQRFAAARPDRAEGALRLIALALLVLSLATMAVARYS